MKYSQFIGIVLCICMFVFCFMPWVYIPSVQATITGNDAKSLELGKPGLLNIIFGAILILFFAIPKMWCKRVNVFISGMNIAWMIRNYVILTTCAAGECPIVKYGFYLMFIAGIGIVLMTFLPKIKVKATDYIG